MGYIESLTPQARKMLISENKRRRLIESPLVLKAAEELLKAFEQVSPSEAHLLNLGLLDHSTFASEAIQDSCPVFCSLTEEMQQRAKLRATIENYQQIRAAKEKVNGVVIELLLSAIEVFEKEMEKILDEVETNDMAIVEKDKSYKDLKQSQQCFQMLVIGLFIDDFDNLFGDDGIVTRLIPGIKHVEALDEHFDERTSDPFAVAGSINWIQFNAWVVKKVSEYFRAALAAYSLTRIDIITPRLANIYLKDCDEDVINPNSYWERAKRIIDEERNE